MANKKPSCVGEGFRLPTLPIVRGNVSRFANLLDYRPFGQRGDNLHCGKQCIGVQEKGVELNVFVLTDNDVIQFPRTIISGNEAGIVAPFVSKAVATLQQFGGFLVTCGGGLVGYLIPVKHGVSPFVNVITLPCNHCNTTIAICILKVSRRSAEAC